MQKNSSNPSFIHTDIHTHVWKGIVFWELKEKAAFKTKIINDKKIKTVYVYYCHVIDKSEASSMTNIIESDCVNINGKKRIYLLISKLLVNSNTIPTNKNLGKQTHLCTTKNVEVENKRIGSQSKCMWFATIL